MFGNGKGPPKPQIRKISVKRTVVPPPTNGNANGTIKSGRTDGNGNGRNGDTTASASRQNSASRLHPESARSSGSAGVTPRPVAQVRADSTRSSPGRGKRKQLSPSTPNFGSSSSEDEDDDSDAARKRARHSPGKYLEQDLKRVMCDETAFKKRDGENKEKDTRIIRGYDITAGDVVGKGYNLVFDKEEGSGRIPEVRLRYPSRYGRER